MRNVLTILFSIILPVASAGASNLEWRRYSIPSTGLSVDIPVSIFTEHGGSPEGTEGRKFLTRDHRSDLTVKSVPNPENDSPALFSKKWDRLRLSSTKELLRTSSSCPAFAMDELGTTVAIVHMAI